MPAPLGTAAPGVNTMPRAAVAYTPEQYSPIISAAIAQAVSGGCGCAALATITVAREECPCVQEHIAALKAKGNAIKQALSQVVKEAASVTSKKR